MAVYPVSPLLVIILTVLFITSIILVIKEARKPKDPLVHEIIKDETSRKESIRKQTRIGFICALVMVCFSVLKYIVEPMPIQRFFAAILVSVIVFPLLGFLTGYFQTRK